MEQAQETASKIEAELKDLKATLKNIQDARPFDQLTVDEVIAARPEIAKTVEEMVKKGKYETPGYHEKFGSESAELSSLMNLTCFGSRDDMLTIPHFSPRFSRPQRDLDADKCITRDPIYTHCLEAQIRFGG